MVKKLQKTKNQVFYLHWHIRQFPYTSPIYTVGRLAVLVGIQIKYGRLAQLVEQFVYTEKVRGSSPLPPTNKELNDFFGGYKRTAQSADQGFFGGIAREFRIFGALARNVFSPRSRFEPIILLV